MEKKQQNRKKDYREKEQQNRKKDYRDKEQQNRKKDYREKEQQNRKKDYRDKEQQNRKKDYRDKEQQNRKKDYREKELQNRKKDYRDKELQNKDKKDGEAVDSKKINRSDSRNRSSRCPVSHKCGGCQFIDMAYEKQLQDKQKKSEELLGQFAKIKPIIGMDDPLYYRNKVHAVYDYHKGKGIVSGIYQENSHDVMPVDSCLLENQKADQIIVSIRELAKSFKIKTYNEDTGYGLLRHVLIRVGHVTGQIMVVLVLGSPIFPSKKNFVTALCKLHPEITTIVLNVNDKQTSMVLGEKEQVIYGKGYIEDELCGKIFRISPKSFYQINSVQTEKLYGKAIEYAGLTGKETVIDAYCGIGTIGLAASDKAGKVIGVELNKDAVKDAIVNAKRNKITNADFYQNDAGKFMVQLAEAREKVDVVFMDPPRSGSTEEFMDAIFRLQPQRVVYISCNQETLARDLAYLTKATHKEPGAKNGKVVRGYGYKVEEITPVDMFCFTGHVETVVLMSKVK